MNMRRYKKSWTDETLQTPPNSLKKGVEEYYPMPGKDIEVSVERVEGCCPYLLLEGMVTFYSGFSADSVESICPIAQWELYQFVSGMTEGASAVDLGIAFEGEDGFVQCGAWGCPTCEAKVVFRLHPIDNNKSMIDSVYEYLGRGNHHCTPEYFRNSFSSESTIQQREDLMKEWDKAGRPLFWDKWATESKLKEEQIEQKKIGLTREKIWETVLGKSLLTKYKFEK